MLKNRYICLFVLLINQISYSKKPIIDLNDENNINTLLFLAQAYSAGESVIPNVEVDKNHKMAIKYATAAAQKGSIEGAFYAGFLYENGDEQEGIVPDNNNAVKWYKVAAIGGHRKSQLYLADLYLQKKLNARELAEDPTKYLEMAANQNNIKTKSDKDISLKAASVLGRLYMLSQMTQNKKADYENAIKYLTIAVQNNNNEDLALLGAAYLYGNTKEANPDYDKSFLYLSKAESGEGKFLLAQWYETDDKKNNKIADYNKALEFYIGAGNALNYKGYYIAGKYYLEGKVQEGKPNYELAYKYFKSAASGGDTDAIYELGLMYAKGLVLVNKKIDAQTAISFLKLASEKGHELATKELKAIAQASGITE